jgi:hypothetical protein
MVVTMRPPDYSVTLDVSRNRQGGFVLYAPVPSHSVNAFARQLLTRGLQGVVTDNIKRGWLLNLEYWPDYVVQLDEDCDLDVLPQIVWALESADIVIASRNNLHWSQRLFAQACNLATGYRHSDWTGVYRVYRSDLLWSLAYDTYQSTGQGWHVEVLNRANELGATIAEVTYSGEPERLRITDVSKAWLRLFTAKPRPRVSEVELW